MINRIEPTIKIYCQFCFESQKEPVFMKMLEYKYIWYRKWGNYKQGIYKPYLTRISRCSNYFHLCKVQWIFALKST